MKQFTTLCSAALVALSLASCSKESYTFKAAAPYHNSTATSVAAQPAAAVTTAAPVTEAPELTAATAPVATPVKASKAPRTYAAHAQQATTTAAPKAAAPTASEIKEVKATIKAMHKAAKQAKKAAAPAEEGKSQVVAALLCFFLGGLGVHDFYLGYIGKGILQIVLSLLIVGFILVIIDFVRILTGSLKPKNGEYAKKI
ncbi:TM2 domain-containing protein [Hymenobacter metallicola]|nr:TM2 domain-containing protein [Hymenobacter metallicola]